MARENNRRNEALETYLGIVDEGTVVSEDDYEIRMEVTGLETEMRQ